VHCPSSFPRITLLSRNALMAGQQGRARKRVTAFCSNIVVTIDGPGKYFIEIVQSLTSQTISVDVIQERERERESHIDARGFIFAS